MTTLDNSFLKNQAPPTTQEVFKVFTKDHSFENRSKKEKLPHTSLKNHSETTQNFTEKKKMMKKKTQKP